jgi:hypothetical protein
MVLQQLPSVRKKCFEIGIGCADDAVVGLLSQRDITVEVQRFVVPIGSGFVAPWF